MSLWELTAGENVRWLYVELNGEYIGTWDESRLRLIEAEPDDNLALFDSPGYDTNGRPQKGNQIVVDKVNKLAKRYQPPNQG
jgi:hypothetical protein